MGVELYFSNQLEQLGLRLSNDLKEDNARKTNIFLKSTIIVPNSNLKKWLQMTIANTLGIAINLEFISSLEDGLWNMLKNLDNSSQRIELLNNEMLQLMLLYLLQDVKEWPEETSLIQKYLLDSDREKRVDHVKRSWQMSKRLAYYFRKYEYHRPDMIRRWQTEIKRGDKLSDMEVCQSYIYNRLFHPADGLSANINGTQFMTLPQYAYKTLNNCGNSHILKRDKAQRNAHFFGLSQISDFHNYLIGNLGRYFNIFIYAFNPCCEFWEDIETPGEQGWRIRKGMKRLKISDCEVNTGELDLNEADNLLLQWWGKPGRENIRLLSELTDYNFYELFCLNETQDIKNDTTLQRLQRHILFRTHAGGGKDFPVRQDCSLQIAACPGLYREVETVYNSIIYNMEADNTLNLTDIAILVPDMERYKPAITSVFNRRPAHIPYNLCDSTAEKESVFGQGVIGLLKLAERSFNRRDVFSLVFNPCFLSRFSLSRDEVQVWTCWVDGLNIFHGFDSQDKQRHGYSENDAHTWRHGLRRLRMARIMDAPQDAHLSGRFEDYMGIIPYDVSGSGDMALLERFCEVIELLFARVQTLRNMRLSCRDWAERITYLIDEFLSIPHEHSTEEGVRQVMFAGLKGLEIYDKLLLRSPSSGRGNSNGNGCLELPMITEFIKAKLASISSGYGSYLTGGVTISEMRPMRPIPFKIVYVMGMGEGRFPGRDNQSVLDLSLLNRRIGDVSRSEADCYMFLEIMVSTRKKLYLTFVSKDLQNDEEFIPCSVVHQLKYYVESEILPDKEYFKITNIPLKGSDINYLGKKADNASDLLVNYSEADRLSFYVENNLLNKVKNSLSDNELKRLERFKPDLNISEIDNKPRPEIERVTIRQLRRFLENPADASLRRHLNLYEDDNNDKSLAENEPFFAEFPLDYNLIMRSMEYCVNLMPESVPADRRQAKTMDFLASYYRESFLKGMTPEDAFCERDRMEFEKTLKQRFHGLLTIIRQIEKAHNAEASNANVRKWHRWIFLGDGNLKDADNKRSGEFIEFDHLLFEAEMGKKDGILIRQGVEIHGSLPMVWQDETGWNSLVLTTRKRSEGRLPEKYVIEPFLFYLTMISGKDSADLIGDSPFNIHLFYKEERRWWRYRLSPEKAKDYLGKLISDYLNRKQFDLMPFETIRKIVNRFNPDSQDDKIIADIDADLFKAELEEELIMDKDLAELVKLSNADVPDDVFEKVKRRFSLLFEAQGIADI